MKRVRHVELEETAAGEYKDLLAILRAKEQRKAPNGVIFGEYARVIKLLLEENERLRSELEELNRTQAGGVFGDELHGVSQDKNTACP